MTTSIKITELTNIGANLAANTLVPVVSLAGTPITQKANVQAMGNLILSGANGSQFAPAAESLVARSVNVANVAGIGNVAVVNLNGNAESVLKGDGTFGLGGASGSNGKIQFSQSGILSSDSNLSWNTSNSTLSTPNISSSQLTSTGNFQLNGWTFTEGGALRWPTTGGLIETNGDNEFEILSYTNVVISTNISNLNSHFTFDQQGIFRAPSNVVLSGSRLSVGPDAEALTLAAPTLVVASTDPVYVQAALLNEDANASADWVAYGANGTDSGGWNDFGFTGLSFNQPAYSITGPGDAYMFAQTYTGNVAGGNLVLATGENGTVNDIVFATGGFTNTNEMARFNSANGTLQLSNASLTFSDNTEQTTAFIKIPPTSVVATNYTITVNDETILVDNLAVGLVTITLPASAPNGKIFNIKKTTPYSGWVTRVTAGSTFIDGVAGDIDIVAPYGFITVIYSTAQPGYWILSKSIS